MLTWHQGWPSKQRNLMQTVKGWSVWGLLCYTMAQVVQHCLRFKSKSHWFALVQQYCSPTVAGATHGYYLIYSRQNSLTRTNYLLIIYHHLVCCTIVRFLFVVTALPHRVIVPLYLFVLSFDKSFKPDSLWVAGFFASVFSFSFSWMYDRTK